MKPSIIGLIIFLLFCGFYKINEQNYEVQKKIKEIVVKHPETLPTGSLAKATSFGFKNVKADVYRLEAIQYIGGNVLSAEYKKYLYKMLDLITDLNPFFEGPYVIGELLLPSYNWRYEELSDEKQDIYTRQGEKIGLKGIQNLCDSQKVKKIEKEFDLLKLWKNKELADPCKFDRVPYYLGYLYYFHLHDGATSSLYYKVTSAIKDSYEGAKIMAAIMQGKSGDRLKAVFMFLSLAQSVETENVNCHKFALDIENLAFGIMHEKVALDEKVIDALSKTSIQVFGEYSDEREPEFFSDTKCASFVVKAVREINLLYLENANKEFHKKEGINARNAKHLFEKGYTKILPQDFQQLEEYGIVYEFNKDTGNFDYRMGGYN